MISGAPAPGPRWPRRAGRPVVDVARDLGTSAGQRCRGPVGGASPHPLPPRITVPPNWI